MIIEANTNCHLFTDLLAVATLRTIASNGKEQPAVPALFVHEDVSSFTFLLMKSDLNNAVIPQMASIVETVWQLYKDPDAFF